MNKNTFMILFMLISMPLIAKEVKTSNNVREKTNKKIEALLDGTQKTELKKIIEEAAQRRLGMGQGQLY